MIRLGKCVLGGALSALLAGCSDPEGVTRVVDPLVAAAIAMNRSGMREATWSYRHDNAEPYWLMVAPKNTDTAELDSIEWPEQWRAAAQDCLKSGDAVMILAQAASSSCQHPIVVPEIREVLAVHKQGGEPAVFELQKSTGDPWLVTLK